MFCLMMQWIRKFQILVWLGSLEATKVKQKQSASLEHSKCSTKWKKLRNIVSTLSRDCHCYMSQEYNQSILISFLELVIYMPANYNIYIAHTYIELSLGNLISLCYCSGYMSPEYALQGRFSVKFDIYSFGVLLLEIITGQRNRTYYRDGPSSNLIGHVSIHMYANNDVQMIGLYILI